MFGKVKKILAAILCLVCLCSCGVKRAENNGKIKVVTTVFPLYDFVRAVGGDRVDITLLIKPGTEVHTYDPKSSDIKAIYDCDLFLYIGGESEEWVNTLLADLDVKTVRMMDCVDTIHHEHHDHEDDEHIWTSPENAALMVERICDELCEGDGKNTSAYRENAEEYIKRINEADGKIKDIVKQSGDPFILVADRFPFSYFAEHYGIDYAAAFGGCAVSTDISIKVMSELIKVCKEKGVEYVYHTELSNKNIASALGEQIGVKLLELHSAHNVTLDDFNDNITYVDIMYRNCDALKEGMNQ